MPLFVTQGEGFLLGFLGTVPGAELSEPQLSRALKNIFSAHAYMNKTEGRPKQSNLFLLTGYSNVFLTALLKSGVIDVAALFYLYVFSVAVLE